MPSLSEFSHCFCPNFPIAFARISIAFARISHCFSPKFGQKQLEILAKAMEKFVQKQWENSEIKRWDIFRAKITEVLGNFTDWHIIFKIYFLDQIKILKDLARNSQYTWKYCILDSNASNFIFYSSMDNTYRRVPSHPHPLGVQYIILNNRNGFLHPIIYWNHIHLEAFWS